MQNFQGYLVRIPGRAFNAFIEHDGHFQIDGVPPGAYTLSIEALKTGQLGDPQQQWVAVAPTGLPSWNVTVDPTVNNGVVDVQLDFSVPACVPIQCPGTPACSNNGTCDTRGGICTCAAGFVGVDCSLPTGGPAGSACLIPEQCSSRNCSAGFCQDPAGTCSFFSSPTRTWIADGAQCGGVPGMPSQNNFGRCFDGFCRQTVCVGNNIGLLDHNGGTPLSYTVSCGSDTCIPVNGGLQAICSSVPKQGAGSACISNDACLSGSCIMGTCAAP